MEIFKLPRTSFNMTDKGNIISKWWS